jgi:L,D-transpeptidase ErfK/SrfK
MKRAGTPVIERVLPGPNNPLGAFWIGLDRPGFGIHGTNAPSSIYQFQTHGCIRLHPDDITDLSARAWVGMPGQIVYEPVLLAVTSAGTVLMEAHPDVYRRAGDLYRHARDVAERRGLASVVDWSRADVVLSQRDGVVTDVTRLQE